MKFNVSESQNRKSFITALSFTLGLILLEAFLFAIYYENFEIIDFIYRGEFLRPAKIIALAIPSYLLTLLFLFAALKAPYKFRALYLALFCIGVLTEYGYQNAFNRFTTTEDLANALFAADWRIASSSAGQYFFVVGAIPCLAFLLLMIRTKPVSQRGFKSLLLVVAAFGIFYSLTAYVSTNVFPSISFNAFVRTTVGFPINWYAGSLSHPALAKYHQTPRQTVEFFPQSRPENNIVFIIDESMRGDHLSINGYHRRTTPFLDNLIGKGDLKNWGIVVSGTTCSITSNNLLLTGVTERPDLNGLIYQFPTIFDYAKAMGYNTHYLDGQLSTRWFGKQGDDFGNRVTSADLNQEILYEIDGELARRVNEIVSNSTGNFIWVNKFGVHHPYELSYPASEANWLPVPESKNKILALWPKINFEENANNYDNAVLFNSQSFFINLFAGGIAADTFYIYTSDHGQNLGENGKPLTHCSTSKNEANVPLFIVADPQIMPETDTSFKASHSNIFATLLDMMNFPENERRQPYSISLFKAKASDSVPRFYFEGNLNSRFSNGLHTFDE